MQSGSLNDVLFGPLGEDYCLYFYVLTVFCFFTGFYVLLNMMIAIVTSKQGKNAGIIILGAVGLLYWTLLYVQNRLLYTMCKKG